VLGSAIAATTTEARRRIARAQSIISLPLGLLFTNCQHTINWVVTGRADSFQVQGVLWALAVPVLTALANGGDRTGQPRSETSAPAKRKQVKK
jgi:hypothetical protein